MAEDVITLPTGPQPMGPYVTGRRAGSLIFLSGLLGITEHMKLAEDCTEQLHCIFRQLHTITHQTALTMQHIVKLTVFLQNMTRDYQLLNTIMSEHLSPPYPARTAVEVARLPRGAYVEIDAILST